MLICLRNVKDNRVIRKVRKTQHQNPEFGHPEPWVWSLHRVGFKKKGAKKCISIQGGMKLRKPSILVVNWVSSCLSFLLSASTAATYIFTAPICTTTIISLELCALNAEFKHFILRLNLYFADTTERGDRGWHEAQRQMEDRVTLCITLIATNDQTEANIMNFINFELLKFF